MTSIARLLKMYQAARGGSAPNAPPDLARTVRAQAVVTFALLLAGCSGETGIRDESSNRFTPTPPGVPFRECSFEAPTPPEVIQLEEGRRIAPFDWHDAAGGVVVTSGETGWLSEQELFIASPLGSLRPLSFPATLEWPVSEVHVLRLAEPRLVFGESGNLSDSGQVESHLRDLLDLADGGDLVITDAEGAELMRHRSAHGALPSPDLGWLAFWRSDDDGLHNLFVTSPEHEDATLVAALTEGDPGSGRSFHACWSPDSRYLHLSGWASKRGHFRWTYDPGARELYRHEGGDDDI